MDELSAASEFLTMLVKIFLKAAVVVLVVLAFLIIRVALAGLAGGTL